METIKELKNIKTYKIYSIFNNLLILGPIITLFFIAKGLSFTEIFILNSVAAITTIIFEVPTGAVSDHVSRKFSLLIGCLLCGVSLVIYILGKDFQAMIIGEIVFSIGLTFRSGTEEAILYDSLKNNNEEKKFTLIEGQARAYTFYAQAVGSLVAGFLYEINIYIPFYISAFFMLVASIITLFYVEPDINRNKKNKTSMLLQITSSFEYIKNNKKVRGLLVFSVVFFFFYRVGFNFFQPYMESSGVPVRYFGLVFFFFNIVAAYASKNADKFIKLTKPKSLMALSFLIAGSFIIVSFINMWVGVVFLMMQQLARGYRAPIIQKYMNKNIPSEKRSTIISIQSLVNSIAIAVLGPLAGYLLDTTNIYVSHLVLGIIMIVLILLANVVMNKANK